MPYQLIVLAAENKTPTIAAFRTKPGAITARNQYRKVHIDADVVVDLGPDEDEDPDGLVAGDLVP